MATRRQNKTLDRIKERIVEKYHPERIILFGSAVQGEMHEDSDLDIVIIKDTDKRFYDRIGEVLRGLWFDEPTPGIGVDVIVYTPKEFSQMKKHNPFVRDEILNKGRVIYEQ